MGHTFHRAKKHKDKSPIDNLIYFVAFLGPIMTLPQVLSIWMHGKVEGISLLTWITYAVLSVFWITYGMIHKEKPIILANFLYLFVNSAIVIGIIYK